MVYWELLILFQEREPRFHRDIGGLDSLPWKTSWGLPLRCFALNKLLIWLLYKERKKTTEKSTFSDKMLPLTIRNSLNDKELKKISAGISNTAGGYCTGIIGQNRGMLLPWYLFFFSHLSDKQRPYLVDLRYVQCLKTA